MTAAERPPRVNPDFVLVINGFVYRREGDRYVNHARRGRIMPGAPNPADVIESWLLVDDVEKHFYQPTGQSFEKASDFLGWRWLHANEVKIWADRLEAEQVAHARGQE